MVAVGSGFTVAVVVALLWQPLLFLTVSVYNPAMAVVAEALTTGLCDEDVNPLGPVQAYVVIAEGPPVRLREVPAQTGELFEAVATGSGFTVTVVVTEFWQPLLFVTVSV
jgi:hypothetical protein